MRLSLKRIFGVLSVIALILLLGGGVVAVILYTMPFGPVIDLVKAHRKAITTDLSVNQAMDLACTLQEVGAVANLETVGPPPYFVTIDAEGRMIPDVEAIKALLAQMEGGN